MPASAAGKMEQRMRETAKRAHEATISIVFGRGVDRPINYERAAHDRVAIDETPVAAVPAAIAIVSHYEITIGRNNETAAIHIVEKPRGPLGTQAALEKVAVRRRKIVAEGILAGWIVNDVGFFERLAIDVHVLIDDADAVARQSDDAFYVVRMIIEGKFEHDDVAAANGAVRAEIFRTNRPRPSKTNLFTSR